MGSPSKTADYHHLLQRTGKVDLSSFSGDPRNVPLFQIGEVDFRGVFRGDDEIRLFRIPGVGQSRMSLESSTTS